MQGDVLPNVNNNIFRAKGRAIRNVGNVTKIVLNAIASLLDCYFLCKKDDGYTAEQCQQLKHVCKTSHTHMLIIWDLKEKLIINDHPKHIPGSVKLHLLEHISYCAEKWGCFSLGNTESYEHYHIVYTKHVYNSTNKINITQNEDMLKLNITNMFLNQLKYMSYINYGHNFTNNNNYINRLIPNENTNENIEYQSITNMSHLPLVINKTSNQIELAPNHPYYSKLEEFLVYSTLNVQKFNNLIKSRVNEQYWNDIGSNFKITLLHGIKYIGGTTSGLGEGQLYCTSHYGHSRRKVKRYDFVDVDIGNNIVQPARLLCLIEMSRNNRILHYAIIQYIRKVEPSGKPFFTCVWDYVGNTRTHEIDIVSVNCIQRPAIVIPMLNLKIKIIQPKHTDKFWYIPIKFFDRTGWLEDLTTVINESGLSLGNRSQREYLLRVASININNDNDDSEINDVNDDIEASDEEATGIMTTDDDDDD